MYRTKNPALNDMVFVSQGMLEDKMTIQGVVEKGVITFGIMLLSGLSVWGLALTGSPEIAFTLSIVGWVFGFIFFFVMIFLPLISNTDHAGDPIQWWQVK